MGSSKSESVIPGINEGSSVTELISILRCSFQQKEYDEVERLLICREEKLRMELNNLRGNFDSLRKERDSLEKDHGIAELNRLTIEQDLKRCKSDCKESREHLSRLRSAYEVLSHRVRTAERRYKYVAEELKNVENEKKTERNKMIEELAKKNEELDKVRTEGDKTIEKLISEKREAKETAALLYSHLQKFGRRIATLEENVAKLLGVDVVHLRRGIYCQEVDAEVEGIFPISSAAMESSVNGGLSDGMDSALKVESGGFEVENLQNGVNDQVESGNGGFGVEMLQNGSQEHLDKTALDTLSIGLGDVHDLPRSHYFHNANGTDNPDFPREGNEHDNGETIGGALSTLDCPLVETDGFNQEKVSPAPAVTSTNISSSNEMGVQELMIDFESTSEAAASFIPVTNRPLSPLIVEISDSEDESLAAGSSDVSVLCAKEGNAIGNKTPLQEESESDCLNDSRIDSTLKRKRSNTGSDDMVNFKVARGKATDSALKCHDGLRPASCQQSIFPSINMHLVGKRCQGKAASDGGGRHDNDDSSESEDDTYFESYMENKVAKFKRYNQNTWKCAADMFSAFENDFELCMNAVCALYRKKIFAEKFNISPSVLFHFDAMSGMALAEYLIDGDPRNKLKKTVLEVQQEDPKVLLQCKDLALHYSDKLFDIYTDGGDRLFRPDL